MVFMQFITKFTSFSMVVMCNLKKTGPVWNHSNDEVECVVYTTCFASVFSAFIVSPTIVADVELQTSDGLYLAGQLICQEEISECNLK